ncbi:MAG: BTAD domain-containing putative transcriptional regulator [Acidimicrobiales bacterium]
MLQVSVLGPLEVTRDGTPITIPAGKTSELLVRLALEAGQVVRAERLLDDLWDTETETARRNTLQSKVTKLRRALGDPDVLVSVDGGYRLALAPTQVDALAVLAAAADAAQHLDRGDARAAATTGATALARYRDDLLVAGGDRDWVEPHRGRLDATRTQLVATTAAARLRLGEAADVVALLEDAVAISPYQERLWELLMTALYLAGRQADALAAYQRVRELLGEELGLDPGPELAALEQRILTHDPSLRVDADDDSPTGNLPSMTAHLVGRDDEVASVVQLVRNNRLVEIIGPGGIGKTALAIAVGRKLAASATDATGGVWLTRLETSTNDDEAIDTLIAAVGVGGEAALFERLRGRPAVVILDNCEHIVDVAAALAVRLLDRAPDIRVLCTSQTPLDVDGERLHELPPLDIDDAIDLFRQRSVRPESGSADAVVDLCRSLDGLPLAIELAAARTRTLSVEEINRRLDDRFGVLSDPNSRRPERRRALRATIRWSYDLLFPDDQRGLWALATFAGGASLDAAESVLEALDVPRAAALDVVGRLTGRSLVIAHHDDGSQRFRLYDSIRAFAVDAMEEAGASDRGRDAHAAWFAAAASTSTAGARSSRQTEHLAFARVERANIDVALAWLAARDPLTALSTALGYGWAWVVLGDSRGAQRILTALAAAGEAAAPPDRCHALLLAGWIDASLGHLEPARELVTEALAIADDIADPDLQARASYFLAYVVSHQGEWAHALELTSRSRSIYDGMDRPWDQVANGLFAARAAISAGDPTLGRELLDDVGRWLEQVDDPWMHTRFDAANGELMRVEHRFDEAVVHIARAAETSRRLGFRQTEAYQVSCLGRAQWQAGDFEAGATTLARSIEKAEAIGDVRMAALARVHLGRVLRSLGRVDEARVELLSATEWHRAAGGGEQAALGECLLAALDAADGASDAPARLEQLLAEARERSDAPVEVFALDALARLADAGGDARAALDYDDEADRRMAAASHFITERDRVDARSARGT